MILSLSMSSIYAQNLRTIHSNDTQCDLLLKKCSDALTAKDLTVNKLGEVVKVQEDKINIMDRRVKEVEDDNAFYRKTSLITTVISILLLINR